MTTLIKNTMKAFGAAVVTSGLILSTAAVPTVAEARPYTKTYACQETKSKDAKTGALIGAVAGAAVGSQVSKNEKGLGAVLGAVVGYGLGSKIGKDNGKQTCNNVENAMEDAGYDHRVYRPYKPTRASHDYRYDRYGYRN